jgi:hypothetical protein
MKGKIYLSLIILITLSAACNNNSATDPEFNYNKIAKPADTTKNTTQSVVPVNTNPSSAIQTSAATNAATGNNGLNPAHGQPGHRCEIAVGAPLTSQPAANAVQPTAPVQQTQSQTVTTSKTTTAPGMNPPHGEPGHRCDIAVGAPLNSKPAAPQKQTAATTTKTVTAPGMNPPHGEPGHRCDIGVGTPLRQPVKTNTDTKPVSTTVTDSTKK